MEAEQTRRTLARRPVRMTVLFRLDDDGANESLGRAVNISEGGLRFDVNRPYQVDASLSLRFQLPGERKGIHLRGRVRWVDQEQQKKGVYALGVQFTEVSAEHRENLCSYLTRSVPGPRGL